MIAYLSLGSNIGDKLENIEISIKYIIEKIGKVLAISKMYRTSSWGFKSENYFLNNVIKIETNLSPQDLLSRIQTIEKALGRKRLTSGYSDRTIDIDILFYENEIIKEENLIVPHPLLQDRNFVIYPLNDIASKFVHPILNETINKILSNCTDTSCCELFFNEH